MHIVDLRPSDPDPAPPHTTALQPAQSLAAAMVEWAEDAITSEDLQGRITSWNRSAERMFGFSCEECLGRRMEELLPSSSSESGTGEAVHKRKDGTLISLSVVVSQICDSQGVAIGVSRIFRDLSEQQRNTENFRALLESAPDAMVIVRRCPRRCVAEDFKHSPGRRHNDAFDQFSADKH